jgi:hypothetical protein
MKKIQLNLNKEHRRYNLYLLIMLLLTLGSCKKQLDVKDPNSPTFDVNVTDEAGITSYAKGGIYWNAFNYGDVWLGIVTFRCPGDIMN